MIYEIGTKELLVQIDRSKILDITVGDTLEVSGFSNAKYEWTEHDQQLVESNPDAEISLKIERDQKKDNYTAKGLIVREREKDNF